MQAWLETIEGEAGLHEDDEGVRQRLMESFHECWDLADKIVVVPMAMRAVTKGGVYAPGTLQGGPRVVPKTALSGLRSRVEAKKVYLGPHPLSASESEAGQTYAPWLNMGQQSNVVLPLPPDRRGSEMSKLWEETFNNPERLLPEDMKDLLMAVEGSA
jgi:hypothetical protein